ncbi:hypothetical protein [Tenacibaculum sp. nBUS_03]|uniref:hypothetical protein n=1 Tax=Tenacibaculum sp. nBUS_03 TaxID=3395320 RepID=UPI003EBD2EDF
MNSVQMQLHLSQEMNIKAMSFDVAKRLATTKGFIEYYFKIVGLCKTQKKAFDLTNELYYLIFGEYRYSDWGSFRQIKNKYVKI